MTEPRAAPLPRLKLILDAWAQSPPGLGEVQTLFMGKRDPAHQATECLIALFCLGDPTSRKRPFQSVVVVLPPDFDQSVDVVTAMTTLLGERGPSDGLAGMEDFASSIKVARAASLTIHAVMEAVRATAPRSAVLVLECSRYRGTSRVETATRPEDLWGPHVVDLTTQLSEVARRDNWFGLLEIGEEPPTRQSLQDALCAIDNCYPVIAESASSAWTRRLADAMPSLIDRTIGGNLRGALAELRAIDAPEAAKDLVEIQLHWKTGAPAGIAGLIRTRHQAHGEQWDLHAYWRLAEWALADGDEDLARTLIIQALGRRPDADMLESLMRMASDLGDRALAQQVAGELALVAPSSAALAGYRVLDLLAERRYAEAADLIAARPVEETNLPFYGWLATRLLLEDLTTIHAEATQAWPSKAGVAAVYVVREHVARHRPLDAIALALHIDPAADSSQDLSHQMVSALEHALVRWRPGPGEEPPAVVVAGLEWLLRHLAAFPGDAPMRARLTRILSVQTAGFSGTAMLAVLLMRRRHAGVDSLEPDPDHRGDFDLDRLSGFFRAALEYLSGTTHVLFASAELPRELLPVEPEVLVHHFGRLLERMGSNLETDDDVAGFTRAVLVGYAVAKHVAETGEDLRVLARAAGALTHAGRSQQARDLVEHVLRSAGDSPYRRKLAWLLFADVYQRRRMNTDALVAIGAAGVLPPFDRVRDRWLEIACVLRAARDLGLRDFAKALVDEARRLPWPDNLRTSSQNRLDTLALSLQLASQSKSSDDRSVQLFLRAATENARAVLATNDEIEPILILLAQALRQATIAGLTDVDSADEVFEQALSKADRTQGDWARALRNPQPSSAQVAKLAARIERARYADDAGFDVGSVALAARRLLDAREALLPPICAYAAELLADQTWRAVRGASQHRTAMPASIDEPGQFAIELSRLGYHLVICALSDAGRLMRVAAASGVLRGVVREDVQIFSGARLREWSQRFPFDLHDLEEIGNAFYLAMEGMGLSSVPDETASFVLDVALGGVPVNMLLCDGEFIGRRIPTGVVPSVGWLHWVRATERPASGRLAWAPISAEEESRETIRVVVERTQAAFEDHGFTVNTDSTMPDAVRGRELVVVVAHGGVVDGRYFQSVADDGALVESASSFAHCFRDNDVVILFVCSAGRLDPHPVANASVGLVRDLLLRGCRAVIASPWPLDTSVPAHWLPVFLARWESGEPVASANFAANREVALRLSSSPAQSLALHVYGDPLVNKQTPVATPSTESE